MKLMSSKLIIIVLKYILKARLQQFFQLFDIFSEIYRKLSSSLKIIRLYNNVATLARVISTALHRRLVEHADLLRA